MKFIKRWLYRMSRDGGYDVEERSEACIGVDSSSRHDEEFKNPMHITLYNAQGGRIIKFSSYDRSKDRSTETTYIVPSEQNFEEALGKFIAVEAIKHNG